MDTRQLPIPDLIFFLDQEGKRSIAKTAKLSYGTFLVWSADPIHFFKGRLRTGESGGSQMGGKVSYRQCYWCWQSPYKKVHSELSLLVQLTIQCVFLAYFEPKNFKIIQLFSAGKRIKTLMLYMFCQRKVENCTNFQYCQQVQHLTKFQIIFH